MGSSSSNLASLLDMATFFSATFFSATLFSATISCEGRSRGTLSGRRAGEPATAMLEERDDGGREGRGCDEFGGDGVRSGRLYRSRGAG